MDLSDTSALVTGGASGLGGATADLLASRGARVVIVDLNEERGKAKASTIGGLFVRADVTKTDDVEAAVAAAAELGPLRSVVNCAGIGRVARTINRDGSPHDLDLYKTVIEINLIGTFNVIRIAAGAMAETEPADQYGGRGAIVNTSSVAGIEGQTGQVAYSSSKGGIMGMTLPVARDLSAIGVRCNTICPGLFRTPLMAELPEAAIEGLSNSVLFPKRLGEASEFAELTAFLLTADYMNGEIIRIDGGIRFQPK